MAISRGNSLLMKKQWAEDGSTVIPNPPVAGTTYRDESVDADNIAEGQKYDGVADSARWNQLLYIMTGILKDTLAHGVLPWINTQDYAEGAVVIGSNGTLYIAKIANGPTTTNVKDPTTDATADTWKTVLAISSVGEGLQIESNKLKLSPYKGATASKAGELGGVPPAAKEDKDKFLKGDGTWAGMSCLPLTGGTLTGPLDFNLPGTEDFIGYIEAKNDQYGKGLYIDTYEEGDHGAYIILRKGSDTINPGGVELYARNLDKSVVKSLVGKTDGNLLWDNKQIVRSVNGVSADNTGDVRGMPAGSVIAFAANATPAGGFLLCNGAAVSRTTYAALFAAIGTTYGSGDGSTTFNLPNLTDKFIQGSGTAGTVKSAGLPEIQGDIAAPTLDNISNAFAAWSGDANAASKTKNAQWGEYENKMVSFSAKRYNSIYGNSTTVQPPAVTMRYYIKY